MKYTSNYSLRKPDTTDIVDINDFNTNVDKIDAEIKKVNDSLTNNVSDLTSQLDKNKSDLTDKINEVATTGTTVGVLERVTKEEIERQIQDGTINNTLIGDGVVTKEKTTFFKRGKNLFDKSTITKGYYIEWSTGTLTQHSNFNVSDYILLEEDIYYCVNFIGTIRIAFYDINKKYISGIQTVTNPVQKPLNAKYIRISFGVGGEEKGQLEVGEKITTYEEYKGFNFDVNNIEDKSIPLSKLEAGTLNQYDKDEIIVEMQKKYIYFYIKGSNLMSNKYLKYSFKRTTVPYDGVSAVSNVDDWSIYEVWQVSRTGEYTFTNDYSESVIREGAWEMAIKEKGMSDFMGGYAHGDEVLTYTFIQLDGITKTLGVDTGFFKCKHIRLLQKSDMFRCLTQNKIGEHLKKYDVTSEGIKLYQEVKFLESIMVQNGSFLGMLPIKRTFDDSSLQVTDRFYTDNDYVIYDVSTLENSIANGCTKNKLGVKLANIFGTNSKISAEVEILNVKTTNTFNMFLANSPLFNKIYFLVANTDYQTTKNEIFIVECMYKINTSA